MTNPCTTCHGTGAIPLPGGPVVCPACGGSRIDVTIDPRVELPAPGPQIYEEGAR